MTSTTTLHIDGSQGEGGGQVLRTSLALSLVTGRPVRLTNIRSGREKPGLLRQHLTAVRAAAAVGSAELVGAEFGSQELSFRPNGIFGGTHHFDIGSAGSTGLVLQTILLPLLRADAPSRVTITGGTHNQAAPPFDFLAKAFLPLLRRMGADVEVTLVRPGFYPKGGGEIVVDVRPSRLSHLELLERGGIASRRGRALVSRIPRHVGEREVVDLRSKLGWDIREILVDEISNSPGPGNAVVLEVGAEHVTEVFTGFGERGVRAETVSGIVAAECLDWIESGVPVGPHLADQLLLPLALGAGGSFRTGPLSLHTTTNADVIRQFLDVDIAARGDGGAVRVDVTA